MSDKILLEGGKRYGRRLANETAFRDALAEGKRVFTGGPSLNGVYFEVTIGEDGQIVYTALTTRPEGV